MQQRQRRMQAMRNKASLVQEHVINPAEDLFSATHDIKVTPDGKGPNLYQVIKKLRENNVSGQKKEIITNFE